MNNDSVPCMDRPVDQTEQRTEPSCTAGLDITVYGPDSEVDGFSALKAEWNELLAQSKSDTFFLTHEWQTVWWEYLGSGELWIIAFRCQDTGRLVGIAPLYLIETEDGEHGRSQRLNIVGCIEVSDYLDIIAADSWESQVFEALMGWLESPEAPHWDVLDLCNLPEVSRTYTILPQILAGSSYQIEITQEDVAPGIYLPQRYKEYLQNLVDKKQRHEIRRKQRRAEREARVGLYVVGPDHNLDAEVDDFIALQMMSRDDKAEFMTVEMKRFFRAVARRMMETGHLRLIFLTLNEEKSAVLFAFEYKRRLLLYNSGYDPDSYSQLSPGWVLLAYAIQYSIACGYELFDFMQGDEEYKFRFGSRSHRVMRVIVRR